MPFKQDLQQALKSGLADGPATAIQVCRVKAPGIADALRTTFPRNSNIGLMWLKQPCKRLRRRRPMDIIVEDGLSGLITVRTHLDCSFAWRESERTD